jgi:Domain of unknown function (DUF4157)
VGGSHRHPWLGIGVKDPFCAVTNPVAIIHAYVAAKVSSGRLGRSWGEGSGAGQVRHTGISAADLFAAHYRVGGTAPDLSGVRVHYAAADDLCRSLGALAFTVSSDIYVRSDCFRPQTQAGLWLLAHEVAHVVQQRCWRAAAAAPAPGRLTVSQPYGPHEKEADAAASAVMAGKPFTFASGAAPCGLQRYMAWEHLLLGSLDPAAVRESIPRVDAVTGTTAGSTVSHLETQCALLAELGEHPAVGQDKLQPAHPGVQAVLLSGSDLVITLGELNILPDYLSHPADIDAAAASYMTPLIQAVRVMNYRELQRLMGRPAPPRLPWGTLRYPNRRTFSEIREAIEVDALGRKCARPAWELYSSVVGRNATHFAPFSWYRWQAFHLKARELIAASASAFDEERSHLRRTAQLYAGYADHFLQDSFAAGHLINKTLVMQWYVEWLLRSRLPLADRALLASMTCQHQPTLHGPDLYHPEPGPDGQRLYPGGDTGPLAVTDPQTALEGETLEKRITASGVTGATAGERQAGYVRYLALLGSGVAQLSAGIVHAYFNQKSLIAASQRDGPRYRLWGDRTLFAGEEGASRAAAAAHASRQAIAELLENGHTEITSRQIFESFPRYVEVDDTLLPLPEWHETKLREMCMHSLFGLKSTQAKRLLMTLTSRRLGVPAEDYRQLRSLLRPGQA